jgi:hypothetical protein
VVVHDLAIVDARWPMFVPAAIECGVAAMYAMPLQLGAIRVGVLAPVPRHRGPVGQQ